MIIVSILFATILFLFYLLHRKNEKYYNYWTTRGFPQVKPMFLFGNILEKHFSKDAIGPYFANMYRKYKKGNMKALGFYSFYTPSLLIVDPELLQDIMIKDFDFFHDRTSSNNFTSPLSQHVFNLGGKKWRNLRAKLTPAFTTSNLRKMIPIMNECGGILENYLIKNAMKNDGQLEIDILDILSRFNLTLSSSRDFGMVNDCINNPDNLFRRLKLECSQVTFMRTIRSTIRFFAPKLIKYFTSVDSSQKYREYLVDIVQKQIEYREKSNVERQDLMQLLIELMNKGFISVDRSKSESDEEVTDFEKLTFDEVASQAFFFFIAGNKILFIVF
jgi:cytochrome P450 family 6